LNDVLEPLYRLEKPVIAAVNGAAAGAGFNIALACDFIIASEKASFIQVFAKVGLVPDLGGLYLLSRVVGINVAKELCFTARKVLPDEAKVLGIVNHVVPHDDLMAKAREIAGQIAAASPTATAMTKSLLNKSSNATLEQMLEFESYAQTVAYLTPEYKEGVQAFREKRVPDFAAAAQRG
jgi:2-(1,2-epoxy-1,2-dihydrophenyl)acetyl-CoA isomerase